VGRGLWLAVWVVLLLACARERQLGRQLSGGEIRELFADKTVQGHHDIHGYDFKSYYDPAGVYRSRQSDKKAARPARWWIAKDDICVRWDDTPEDLCRRMFVDDQGVYRKVKLAGDSRIVVVTFESFRSGNPERL
jgi:hypothetical protein